MNKNRLIGMVLVLASIAVVTADAKWARVQDGEVMEVFKRQPNFHPDIMEQIVECPDNVEPKWRKNGASWEAPMPAMTPAEKERDAFNALRRSLLSMQGIQARKLMADRLAYRLNGSLAFGYPDPTQPMCTNATGQALTVAQFADYIQECDDAGMATEDLKKLKQDAKAARLYLKSLKGD